MTVAKVGVESVLWLLFALGTVVAVCDFGLAFRRIKAENILEQNLDEEGKPHNAKVVEEMVGSFIGGIQGVLSSCVYESYREACEQKARAIIEKTTKLIEDNIQRVHRIDCLLAECRALKKGRVASDLKIQRYLSSRYGNFKKINAEQTKMHAEFNALLVPLLLESNDFSSLTLAQHLEIVQKVPLPNLQATIATSSTDTGTVIATVITQGLAVLDSSAELSSLLEKFKNTAHSIELTNRNEILIAAELSERVYKTHKDDKFRVQGMNVTVQYFETYRLFRNHEHSQWAIFRLGNEEKKYDVICFRGTNSILEAIADLIAIPQRHEAFGEHAVHTGIASLFLPILSSIHREITTKLAEDSEILICGHSLGGAFAKLLYLYLKQINVDFLHRCTIYTFGAPLVCHGGVEKANNVHCIVNGFDVVPRLLGNELLVDLLNLVKLDNSLIAQATEQLAQLKDYTHFGHYYWAHQGRIYQVSRTDVRVLLKVCFFNSLKGACIYDHKITSYLSSLQINEQ